MIDHDDPLRESRGFYHGILMAILLWVVVFGLFSLVGCATYTGYTPPVLINGYDPTLSSHAEALGLKEPYRP